MPLVGAFIEFTEAARGLPRTLALRGGPIGMLRSTVTDFGTVWHWILAARTEVCPLMVGSASLQLWPCAVLDLGATGVSGREVTAKQDAGLWAALAAHGRVRWWVTAPVALEAQLGALLPLTQYEIHGRYEPLYRTATMGVSGALGVSMRIP
jgi:hypothetical protein